MKYILVALTLLNTIGLFSQVSIKEGVFENGLSYPVLSDKYDSTKYEIINKDILSGLKDLESNVYCISDYGYVQKGNHIQLQVMCTCMEMDKGELRFFFYNLETGMPVKYSDLFDLKSKDKAMKYLDNKVSSFISVNSNECINSLKPVTSTNSIHSIIVLTGTSRLKGKHGIDSVSITNRSTSNSNCATTSSIIWN